MQVEICQTKFAMRMQKKKKNISRKPCEIDKSLLFRIDRLFHKVNLGLGLSMHREVVQRKFHTELKTTINQIRHTHTYHIYFRYSVKAYNNQLDTDVQSLAYKIQQKV